MLLYKVASFVVIDFENGVDYISFSVFDFSALKNGTEYSFVNDQFQVNDYTDVTFIKDKSGTAYTEATLDAFISTIKVIDDPNIGNLPAGGTTGQILAKIDGTDYNAEWIDNLLDEVNPVCKLGENISKGQAVYISGADGTNKVIKKASNATELTSSKTFGLLSASGVTNDKIRVITTGYLSGLNTSSANEGDPVWLGVNGNLIYGIANKPHAPAHLVFIGFVVRKNNVNGQIYVRVQNGFELDELHDVKIQSPANKNTIFYNSSNSLWENRLIGIADVTDLESALSGKEPTINAGTTSQYWRGDKSWQTLDKSAVGLGNVDNTSDLNKPISTATQTALNSKQDSATAINTSNIGSQSVAYATNAGNSDTLDGYHASAFQMALTNPVTGTGILNYVAKFGSSSTIENSQIYDNGFQVGVGLTNPSSRFHVNGLSILTNPSGDNYNENLRLPQTSSGYSSIAMGGPVATLGTSVQQWTLVKHPTNNFSIRHYNTDHLFINTDGNVGLGTSAFVYPASGRKVFAINGSTQALLEFQNGGFINGYIYVSSTLYEQSSAFAPQTFLTSNSERMRITEGGRIGIGTTNPETILHLNGNITVPFTHTYNVEGSYTRKAIFYTGWNNNGDSKDFLIIQAAGNSDSKVCFPSGNVGIGTNDPRSRLSVQNGEISINNLPDGYSTPMAVIGAFNNDAQNGGLILKTATGNSLTEKIRITSDGNLGLGTTNPTQKLAVDGNIFASTGNNGGFLLEGGNAILRQSSTSMGFNTNGSEKMRITSGGNVGIGTTSPDPSAILHLESTTQGFLPPRMDNSEINSISNPAEGLIVYSTQSKCLFLFDGASWQKIAYA